MQLHYKKIGIIAALSEEISSIIEASVIKKVTSALNTCFYEGKIHSQAVVSVKCGVGKVNSAIVTQKLIDTYLCDAIINIGLAGAVCGSIKKNDIVISKNVIEHDMDATEGLGVIPNMQTSIFEADKNLLKCANEACEKVCYKGTFHTGTIVSGDQFIFSNEKKQWLSDNFNALCTEMEGAAIGHTCYVNNVPFVVLRSISDLSDSDALHSFEEHKQEACDITYSVLLKMLS